jgi:hypothetical protein
MSHGSAHMNTHCKFLQLECCSIDKVCPGAPEACMADPAHAAHSLPLALLAFHLPTATECGPHFAIKRCGGGGDPGKP